MNEKDLLKQLNKLKDVQPSSDWKKQNREILLKQVFSAEHENEKFSSFDWMRGLVGSFRPEFLNNVHYTSVAVVLILLFVMSGGFFSLRAAQDAKPGDSLYMAKIASEKTQLALAIGEKNKVRLGIAFAGNRADEISKVLSESSENDSQLVNSENKEKVEKLVSDFKKEIDSVKSRLAKIGIKESKEVVKEIESAISENVDDAEAGQNEEEIDDSEVFSANLGKASNGIQISDSSKNDIQEKVEINILSIEEDEEVGGTTTDKIDSEDVSTSSDDVVISIDVKNDPQLILKQAEELLNIEDYEATLSKLDEAGELIGQIGIGQVKGEEEWASSSSVVVPSEDDINASSTDGM